MHSSYRTLIQLYALALSLVLLVSLIWATLHSYLQP